MIRRPEWGQEGGADAAVSLLRAYDPATDSWALPKEGEYWQAVALAHELNRLGAGQTIAVIDDGFDTTLPALESMTVDSTDGPGHSAHGTAVALLIHAVAPLAHLDLYPVARNGTWDAQLIPGAIRRAAASSASLINLSLGKAFPLDSVLDLRPLEDCAPWPRLTGRDRPFWIAECLGELNGWRDILRPTKTEVGDAAGAATRLGKPVFAAAGNARGYVFSPASEAAVLSVAFQRVTRSLSEGLTEEAAAGPPTFDQSELSDFSVVQPPTVLGSSFATPLMTGFAALMIDLRDLPRYRETVRLAGLAAQLFVTIDGEAQWDNRRQGVVDRLFRNAVENVPHVHDPAIANTPCPECSLFALDAFVNLGLMRLQWSELDTAERLLRSAANFAPQAYAPSANLALVYARRADVARKAGKLKEASSCLALAIPAMARAVELRPDHLPYQVRLAEFQSASADPGRWDLQP